MTDLFYSIYVNTQKSRVIGIIYVSIILSYNKIFNSYVRLRIILLFILYFELSIRLCINVSFFIDFFGVRCHFRVYSIN